MAPEAATVVERGSGVAATGLATAVEATVAGATVTAAAETEEGKVVVGAETVAAETAGVATATAEVATAMVGMATAVVAAKAAGARGELPHRAGRRLGSRPRCCSSCRRGHWQCSAQRAGTFLMSCLSLSRGHKTEPACSLQREKVLQRCKSRTGSW